MRPIPQAQCLSLIRSFEKGPDGTFAATPYQDASGNWTNGWGNRCAQDAPPITLGQANDRALANLASAAQGVCDAIYGGRLPALTDGQYAALIDFAYNVGVGAFRGSTLCHFVNAAAMNLVPAQFLLWVHEKVNGVQTVMPGLIRRRQAEVDVWRS